MEGRLGFKDVKATRGQIRTIYGTLSLGQKYDYDPDTKAFYFYAGGSTFKYEPAERQWTDATRRIRRKNSAARCSELHGLRLHNKQFILFAGGNVQSDRGDPAHGLLARQERVTQLKLDVQPPHRNSRLVYDPVNKLSSSAAISDQLVCDTWHLDVVKQTWSQAARHVATAAAVMRSLASWRRRL